MQDVQEASVKSIRTTPAVHAAEGDERIRTAVCEPSADAAYDDSPAVAHLIDWQDPIPTAICGAKLIGEPAGPNPPHKCSECERLARAEADRG